MLDDSEKRSRRATLELIDIDWTEIGEESGERMGESGGVLAMLGKSMILGCCIRIGSGSGCGRTAGARRGVVSLIGLDMGSSRLGSWSASFLIVTSPDKVES